MSAWTRMITRVSGLDWRSSRVPRQDDSHPGEEVARRAIRLLREAELDFDRCGQLVLSQAYRRRAAVLEQELASRRS